MRRRRWWDERFRTIDILLALGPGLEAIGQIRCQRRRDFAAAGRRKCAARTRATRNRLLAGVVEQVEGSQRVLVGRRQDEHALVR